uniref:60S ribosomal protein L29 n=1 Tax=Seriola dumerili TaxID=41447 RepID=A0A3B4VCL8_SERDU
LAKQGISKNYTTHNQSCKAHRNGIKRPRSEHYESLKEGVDPNNEMEETGVKKHHLVVSHPSE